MSPDWRERGKTNPDDRRLVILIYSLDEFQKHHPKEQMKELLAKCPYVKSEKERQLEFTNSQVVLQDEFNKKENQQKEDFNKIQFLSWLLEEKFLEKNIQDKQIFLRQEIMAELIQELHLESNKKLEDEKYANSWRAYMQDVAKDAWDAIEASKKNKIDTECKDTCKKLYSAIKEELKRHIVFLKKQKEFLEKAKQNCVAVINKVMDDYPARIKSLYENLSNKLPDNKEIQLHKERIFALANKFDDDKKSQPQENHELLFRKFVENITEVGESIKNHLESGFLVVNDALNNAKGVFQEFISGLHSERKVADLALANIDRKNELDEHIKLVKADIKNHKMKLVTAENESKLENPRFDADKLRVCMADCSKTMIEENESINLMYKESQDFTTKFQAVFEEVKQVSSELGKVIDNLFKQENDMVEWAGNANNKISVNTSLEKEKNLSDDDDIELDEEAEEENQQSPRP